MMRKLAGGLFVLLLTASATPCLANDLTGSGGIGIRGGTLFWTKDELIKEQASPRLSGDLVLSYQWTDHITADVTVGWGWSKLDSGTDSFFVANVVPLWPPT